MISSGDKLNSDFPVTVMVLLVLVSCAKVVEKKEVISTNTAVKFNNLSFHLLCFLIG
jgi:hypothetical protein